MALERSGTSYFNVGDVSAIDITGTALTICCWHMRKSDDIGAALVSKWSTDSTTTQQYRLRLGTGSAVECMVRTSTTTYTVNGSTGTSNNAWNHFALRLAGTGTNQFTAWLNGVQDGQTTVAAGIQNTTSGLHLFSDANAPNNQPIGPIAEVGIWNVALNDGEMLALGRGAIPGMIRPNAIRGYWPLHENVLGQAVDLSGQRNSPSETGAGSMSAHPHPPVGRFVMEN